MTISTSSRSLPQRGSSLAQSIVSVAETLPVVVMGSMDLEGLLRCQLLAGCRRPGSV